MMCGFMWLAMLLFEINCRSALELGINICKIFHLGRYIFGYVYGLKSGFMAKLECHRKTKFLSVYLRIYLPK